MTKRSIQGYVELASGLGEMTKGAAKDAAAELVSLTNADLSPKKVTKQASKLADDLIAAANTNRRNLVALVRSEVDKAVGRLDVGGLQQELSTVSDTLHMLRGQVEELASTLSGRSTKAVAGTASGAATIVDSTGAARDTGLTAVVATPGRRTARSALKKTATKVPTAKRTATKSAPLKKSATTSALAKKAATTTSTAKKTATTSAPAKKASGATSTAKKSTAKATPAKKSTTAKKTTAKATPAKRSTTAKKTTAKATPAKKTTTPKQSTTAKKTTTKATPAKKSTAAANTTTSPSAGGA